MNAPPQVVFGVVLFCWGLITASARADLDIPQPQANAGEVRCGQRLVHSFVLHNTGRDTVTVTGTRASCGCLTPRLSKSTIAPGERGEIALEVNTLSQAAGPHTWNVQLAYTSGEQAREVQLQLAAQIVAEVTVQPALLNIHAENAIEHELVLTDIRAEPLTITDARGTCANIRARVAEPGQDSAGRRVQKVMLNIGGFSDGRHDESLVIYTNDPLYRELKVPVTVVKRSRQAVSIAPAQVDLVLSAGQSSASRILLAHNRADVPVKIEAIQSSDPAISCTWAQGPGAKATVKLVVDRSKMQSSDIQATVSVHFVEPPHETLTVPIRVKIQ